MDKSNTDIIKNLEEKIENLKKERDKFDKMAETFCAGICHEKYLDEHGNEQCDARLSILHGIKTKAIFDKSGKIVYCIYRSVPGVKDVLATSDITHLVKPVLIVPIFKNMKMIND